MNVANLHIVKDTGCRTGKWGYLSRKDAKRMAKGQPGALKGCSAYDCPSCDYWHLGHRRAESYDRR